MLSLSVRNDALKLRRQLATYLLPYPSVAHRLLNRLNPLLVEYLDGILHAGGTASSLHSRILRAR